MAAIGCQLDPPGEGTTAEELLPSEQSVGMSLELFLLTDVGEAIPLWVMPLFDREARTVKEGTV